VENEFVLKGHFVLVEAFWFDVKFTELSGKFVLKGHVVLVGDEVGKIVAHSCHHFALTEMFTR